MAYQDLREFVRALEKNNELKRIPFEVDPRLEITEFADRAVKQGGPALLFERPTGFKIPVLVNAFASMRKMEIALEVDSVEEVARRIVEFLEMRMPEGLIGKLKMLPKLAEMGAFFPKIVSKGPCQEVCAPAASRCSIIRCCNAGRKTAGASLRCPWSSRAIPTPASATAACTACRYTTRALPECTGRPTNRARNIIAACSNRGRSAWTSRWPSAPTRPPCTRPFCRCPPTSTK